MQHLKVLSITSKRYANMMPGLSFSIVCLAILVVGISARDFSLTTKDKEHVKEMHERFCGTDRMCLKSEQTANGECRTCPGCQCDSLCDKYGDCCADKAIELLDTASHHQSIYQCHSNAYKLIKDRKAEFSFHSIQKCPDDTEANLAELCENPEPKNITLAIPAQSKTELYRNQFCAICNNVTDYTLWSIKAECKQLVWLNTGMTSQDIIQSYVDNIGCAIFLQPTNGSNYRTCHTPEEEIISSCNNSIQLKQPGLASNEELCHSYSAPIHLYSKVYRNIFCYFCNHGSLDDSFIPSPSCAFDTSYPFSVTLDPEAIEIVQKTVSLSCECDPGYIYDKYSDHCKQIECTADRVLRDETCSSVIRSASGLVYLLEVLLKPSSPLLVNDTMELWIPRTAKTLKKHMTKLIGGRSVGVGLFRLGVYVRQTSRDSPSEIMTISIHSKFVIQRETKIDGMESTLIGLRGVDWVVPLDNNVKTTFTTEPFWTDPDNATSYSKMTKEAVGETESLYKVDHGFTVDLTEEHDALYVSKTLKCPRVKVFRDVDFTYNEETGELLHIGSNDTLNLNQFEPSSNKSGYICFGTFKENVTNCGRAGFLSPVKLSSGPLKYVSLVCQSLAIICLFLTFLVFCIFKGLRNLPGKITMSMVFTLFLAMLLYTVGSSRVENQAVCKAIGMTIHFFLLSSFTWMSISTVHMYTVFKNILLSGYSESSNRKKYIIYLSIGILVPVLIVASTVAGNHFVSTGQDIGYGGNICYVSNFYSVVLALGAPVIVVVTLNGCLFAATVMALKRSTKQHKELKSSKSSLSMYVKLSTLTGINWFFALVSVLVDSDVYKYLFVILCALQGVYIFVSFVCTRDVLYLFRDCCRNRSTGSKAADEIKIKMTFNGTDLEIEELEDKKDPDYACLEDLKGDLALKGMGEEKGISARDVSDDGGDYDSMSGMSRVSTIDRHAVNSGGDKEVERIHQVDMHNADACNDSDYGLLMHATTIEVRDPCNVMFNPVFE